MIQRKENEAARIITGATSNSPILPRLIEAGLIPVKHKGQYHVAVCHERVMRLTEDKPSGATASDTSVKVRYNRKGEKLTPPRETTIQVLTAMGLNKINREEIPCHPAVPPWLWEASADIRTELQGCKGKDYTAENRKKAMDSILNIIDKDDIAVFTDGSVVR